MENIFDELKQFVVKEISDTIILQNQAYMNLINGKKYLIVYFDKYNKPILLEYAGKFYCSTPCYPGAYGDLAEGYFFYGITNVDDNITYAITGEFNSYRLNVNITYTNKFYELEDNFDKKVFQDVFLHITTNNNLNQIENNIQIYSSDESICIYLLDFKEYINFDSE